MLVSELKKEQRYLFHYKNNNRSSFRATFDHFVTNAGSTYINLKKYAAIHDTILLPERWIIHTHLISKIESLSEIVGSSCKLPDDVLNLIDNCF